LVGQILIALWRRCGATGAAVVAYAALNGDVQTWREKN
jgi:hypothetical protein